MISRVTSDRPSSELDQQLAELLAETADKLRAGESVDLSDYVRRYPDFAERLEQLLPAMRTLAELGQSQSSVPSSVAGRGQAFEEVRGTLGDFRILREIGRGGMGVVYEAEQVSLGRRMALKVLPFAGVLDERQLTRFRNEARAAASLKHPNIVGVHSVGCERGVHYYAMEFIEGRTLAAVIAELRQEAEGLAEVSGGTDEVRQPFQADVSLERLTYNADTDRQAQAKVSTHKPTASKDFFRRVAEWGIQAAEGLEHAHQMGIVHRDIKPSNLLVDASGHLWITDFGLAQVQTDAGITMTGDLLGTLRYMSPEQAAGRSRVLDHRTDVYSLGVTLYELLTLRPPFSGDDRHEVLRQIGDDEPPAPRRLNSGTPRDLETIVLKAMAKDPQARYATAHELADDLQRFLADEPIRAKRAGPLVRVKKWTKRHKTVAAVVVATLFAVAVFGTATAVQAYHRHVRLTVTATEGLADVRVAMAQKEFAQAQRRATEIQAELAAAPKLKAQFGPELEDLLQQAAARLRLQRFQALAAEARFQTNGLLVSISYTARKPQQARRPCQAALEVFHVLDNPAWVEGLQLLPIEPAEQAAIKESVGELLFLLANVEARSDDSVSGARRAIELLNQVELLAPQLRALFEYRASYRRVLHDDDGAETDLARAATIQRTQWLDRYLHAMELFGTHRLHEAFEEIDTALTLRVDDYWSWFLWGEMQGPLLRADRVRWASSICIHLRPDEPMAWLQRGVIKCLVGDQRSALPDLAKALELSGDAVQRYQAYHWRGKARILIGELEAALGDLNDALRLYPNALGVLVTRAECYQALGHSERASADARTALEGYGNGTDIYNIFAERMRCYAILNQPREAVEDAVREYNNPRVREWFDKNFKENIERHGRAPETFLLAMVYWKVGQKDYARRWYDKAIERIDKSKPEDETLRRYHEEAAAMLGIPDKQPAEKPKTDKAKGEMRHGDTGTKPK